jgi:hypothetical protein
MCEVALIDPLSMPRLSYIHRVRVKEKERISCETMNTLHIVEINNYTRIVVFSHQLYMSF